MSSMNVTDIFRRLPKQQTLKRAAHIAQSFGLKEVVPTATDDEAKAFDKDDSLQILDYYSNASSISSLSRYPATYSRDS